MRLIPLLLWVVLGFGNGLIAQTSITELTADWMFRGTDTLSWMPATVPGTVHTDLFANGIVGDPFADNNEINQQWIENRNWEYLTVFSLDEETFGKKHHELNFKGLDTYADVYLNDSLILEANNMFRSWQVDVTGLLNEEGNVLNIVFTSPILKNDSIAKNHLRLPAGSDTSQYSVYPFTRKAAYHFGWDWAPRFVTCGIWQEVYLESWSGIHLRDVTYQVESLNKNIASVTAWLSIESDFEQKIKAYINDQEITLDLSKGKNHLSHHFPIDNPQYWWPNGSGKQNLYEFKFGFIDDRESLRPIDSQKIGFRTIELINEPDSIGTSFYFKVNGKPIFMKGANYIPQDVFLPRVQNEDYERLIKQVKDAGMNMLRVWGGGIYERDIFYNLCDEYGILVWQDFMFANTLYPSDSIFTQNVTQEVYQQISRLKKHPCLALWCGNNEIDVAWKNWGWQKQFGYSPEDSVQLWANYNNLFQVDLKALVTILDGKTPYVSTSPQSNWGTPENFNHGSMHYWGVWHGPDDISGFKNNIGRFMAEWGFQSFPDYELLKSYVSTLQLSLQSKVMKNRQKSYVGNGKIIEQMEKYVFGQIMPEISFEEFVVSSQMFQALAYKMAASWHINSQPHCMGTLLWQLNDCWPGPSWSIINYNGKPKEAYKAVKTIFTEK